MKAAPGVRSGTRAALPALGIALAAAWIFWPSLGGGWLWDDGLEIARNPMLRDPSGWWRSWIAPVGMDYFPLKSTLQWVQWHLWGPEVAGYHVVSLGLHILSAWLIWRILGQLGVRHGWLGGLIFAVHPVAVESVAWISEQKNTLSLPPLLLAMSAYLDYDRARGSRLAADPGRGPGPYYLQSLLWFSAAMLCKSTVAMFPVVLLLYAWWRRGRITRADFRASAPFFTVSLGLGLATVWFQQHRAIGLAGAMPGFESRLVQAGWSAVAYLGECVVPSGLMPIYPPAGRSLPAVVPWLGLAVILGFLWIRRKSGGRHALFGLGWFLLNLVPILGLIPMSYLRVAPRADHFVYLSLAGLAGLAGAGLAAGIDTLAGSNGGWRRVGLTAVALIIVAVLAPASRAYAGVFRDEAALWNSAVERNPDAWLARNNLGKILLETDRPAAAAVQLEIAARIEPDSAEVRANLGNAYAREERLAEARVQYERALRLDPSFAGAHYDLGRLLLESGDAAASAVELQAALRLDPSSATAHNNLGLAYARLGRVPEALDEYARALRLDPALPEAHLNLGNVFFRLGRLSEAIGQYRAALQANPHYGEAEYNWGCALRQLRREDEARVHFEAAARLGIGR